MDKYIDIDLEKYFDDSSLSNGAEPQFFLLMGGICAGKTYLRRKNFSQGFVVLDAAEIFLELCDGEYFEVGEAYEDELQFIGGYIASRAIREKRNIVTEIIGACAEDVISVGDLMVKAGYIIHLRRAKCDREEAWQRNVNRDVNNISAYYTESYHQKWLKEAAEEE